MAACIPTMKGTSYFLLFCVSLLSIQIKAQTSRSLFRLVAGYSDEITDPMVIYFDKKNSVAFHKDFDALKLMNTDLSVPNIYSFSGDGSRLSIMALPSQNLVNQTIPLGLKTGHEGMIIFNAISIVGVPYPYIYFIDAQSLKVQELHGAPKVSVRLAAGTYEKRFSILFSLTPYKEGIPAAGWNAYSSKARLYITLDSVTGKSGTLAVFTIQGREVFNEAISGAGLHMLDPALPAGIYLIRLNSTKGTHSRKVFIGL